MGRPGTNGESGSVGQKLSMMEETVRGQGREVGPEGARSESCSEIASIPNRGPRAIVAASRRASRKMQSGVR